MTNYWFITTKQRPPIKLALLTFLLAFVVIVLGAYTRLTDAGLSCPDWPHCYGYLTVPHTTSAIKDATLNFPATPLNSKKAWTEMTHRYVAGAEGLLILFLAFSLIFRNKQQLTIEALILSAALIILLGVQVLLGMLTVTEKLKPVIVLSHLVVGVSILSVLWCTYLSISQKYHALSSIRLRQKSLIWFSLAIIIISLQIALGGWVSTHYAGLACVDFPYCNGRILPPIKLSAFNHDLITIHMLHRIGALITALYVGGFALYLLLSQRKFMLIALTLLILLSLQITLGILNLLWLRPVSVALMHQTVGILLLLTAITAFIKARSALRGQS